MDLESSGQRGEPGLLYLEASVDGQIEKVMGDRAWLPFDVRAYDSNLGELFPALAGAQAVGTMELDFVEIAVDVFVDIHYQCDDGRQFAWLRNTSRHAAHLRAAQQVANGAALREAIATRWLDDIRRDRSHVRLLLDEVPVPVAYWSPLGTLLYANPVFCERANASMEGLTGLRGDHEKFGSMRLPSDLDMASIPAHKTQFFRQDGGFSTAKSPASRLLPDFSPSGEVTGFLDVTGGDASGLLGGSR